jgi:hypothetical protein
MTVENLATHYSAGLVVTFVATRDIQPGEEISWIMAIRGRKPGTNTLKSGRQPRAT